MDTRREVMAPQTDFPTKSIASLESLSKQTSAAAFLHNALLCCARPFKIYIERPPYERVWEEECAESQCNFVPAPSVLLIDWAMERKRGSRDGRGIERSWTMLCE